MKEGRIPNGGKLNEDDCKQGRQIQKTKTKKKTKEKIEKKERRKHHEQCSL